jgi:Flp pilus assembly protein TadD/4-amino-4-deoxy-L-arabinose transferase-like glycosyltransferase
MPPRARLPRYWLLAAVILLGLALRVANLADTSSSPFFTRPVVDGRGYDNWAMAIRSGKAPAEPFYQDPLYPYVLALIYSVFGHSFWAVYVIQLLLGIGLLLIVFDTTRLLFDPRAGIVAAFLAALYKPFIFYEGQVEKTALAVFLVAFYLWAFVRAINSQRRIWPLLSGLGLGLAALTRANILIFAPLLPLGLFFARSRPASQHEPVGQIQGKLIAALIALAGTFAVIAPVSIRNSILAREFTLTTTQGGQNLYIGNSEYNRTGQYVPPPWVRPNPDFEQADFQEYARKAGGTRLSYSGISRFYVREAVRWMTIHPGNFLALLARKAALYFNNYEIPDNQDLYFFARYSWVLRLPLLGFGVVFGLGLAGILLLTGKGDTPPRDVPFSRVSLVVFLFGYAVSVVAFFVFSRYRLPSLPALLPFAGAMVVRLWDCRNLRTRTINYPRLAGGLLLTAVCFAPTMYPLHQGSGSLEAAQCLVNLGSSYYHEGDTAHATASFEEALRVHPGHAEALRNLGIMAFIRQRPDQALGFLSRAVQSDRTNPVTHHYLGRIYEQQGRLDSACAQYRQAVALAPGRVEYRFSLAGVLQKPGSLDAALAQYDTMIALDPNDGAVRHNHAVALYVAGRTQEAWQEYETSRRLGGPASPQLEQMLRAALTR